MALQNIQVLNPQMSPQKLLALQQAMISSPLQTFHPQSQKVSAVSQSPQRNVPNPNNPYACFNKYQFVKKQVTHQPVYMMNTTKPVFVDSSLHHIMFSDTINMRNYGVEPQSSVDPID